MMLKGDCIEVMKAMKPNSVHAIVTDPPYNLHFMGKDWDKDLLHEKWLAKAFRVLKPGGSMLVMGGTRTSHRLACAIEDEGFIIKDTIMWLYGQGFPKAQDLGKMIDKRGGNRKHWDGFKVGGIKPAYEPIIWAVKPSEGSYVDNVLKWGVGAVNVDECRIGYESPADKQEQAEKNPHTIHADNEIYGDYSMCKEPWKQPKGRFPANIILSHHPECVQVGVKKIKPNWSKPTRGNMDKSMFNVGDKQRGKYISHDDPDGLETVESWDCHPDCAVRILDEQSGMRQSKWGKDSPDKLSGNINYVGKNRASQQQFRGDSGGASRFFKQCNYGQEEWLCHEGCALRQLDEQSGVLKSGARDGQVSKPATNVYGKYKGKSLSCESSSGGASRFFYCAKASRGERNAGLEGMEEKSVSDRHGGWGNELTWIDRKDGKGKVPVNAKMTPTSNNHPTVKPIKLFEWLIKLVTRQGQIVLDPFIGSGTTGIAAHNTGRKCVGIEKEEEYLEIAKRRATHWRSQPRQLEMI